MSEPLSLSIFTIEVDRKPVLAFAAKKYEEAVPSSEMKGCEQNSDRLCRSATTYPFCAFASQMLTNAPATTKKRRQNQQEIQRRSSWPTSTKDRPAQG
jgi:hypothetical protein